jgi:curli biogenesis system outer membrane secretion channel CsgG
MTRPLRRSLPGVALVCLLSACAGTAQLASVDLAVNEPLVKGPAVMDVVTPFDNALSCLDGRINKDQLRFSVGAILDATGKEQVTDGGSGKFVTQGAGDIVQSALFMAGATVVNRRDPRIIDNEVRWGLLDAKKQSATTFFITGSINSLDFLPGSGFDVQIAGLGPRFRQQRILVGLDLSLTEASTGRIVANIPLQKQVVSTEDGFGVGRFFGQTLVSADFGGKQREALNLVLRQMLNLATFELLTQVMKPSAYGDCMAMVEAVDGVTDNSRSRRKLQQYVADQAKAAALAAKSARPATPPNAVAAPPAADPLASAAQNAATAAASAGTAAATVAANGASLAANPNAGPLAQGANFGDEQSTTSASTRQALLLPKALGGPAEALSVTNGNGNGNGNGTSNGNASVLAAVAQAASTPVPEALPGPQVCSFAPGEFPQVTPLRATQPGNSLLVRSRTAQTLCLADPSGRFVPHALTAGSQQRFEGRAPWKLQAERLNEIEIVYQGLPLRRPAYIKDRMELLERPLPAPAG